ncbi:hypothetical protein [Salinimicrobium terrae]|uniref:hypothetical protein n=1 Tax=Salinimicrobium terrae TaxID=470866 RepID=UPI0012EBA05C|nr:hypothetical protein [Salinimicrobium terrae]
MDSENMDNIPIPNRINDIEMSKLPIQKVRKSMIGEIITQLICIAVFFAAPSFVEMYRLPEAIYYILMFITSLITLGYLAKMAWFLRKTGNMNQNSKETVLTFINDLKLTLEVYKTAIIAGSLLLPFSIITFILGIDQVDEEIFTNFILLNMSTVMLIICIVGYIILAILIYFVTVAWSNSLYGIHLNQLEKTLKEFDTTSHI